MKGNIQHIIIAVVGIFFMLSVSEINTSYFHNTFDDDYDYYIQPDNSPVTSISLNVFTDISLVCIPAINGFILTEANPSFFLKPVYFKYYSPPLHVRNCIWLI
ncbi:MAG: hypothetical protein PHT07_17505 [Paludibacter sp.]|nr:hypothetical protein [Paludibacter sp.]